MFVILTGKPLPPKKRDGWSGAVAQLGERIVRNDEVRGSIPLSSTNPPLKNSDVDLLLGGAALGFYPDFEIELFNIIVFPL